MRTWGALDTCPQPEPVPALPGPPGLGRPCRRPDEGLADLSAPPPAVLVAARKAAERGPAGGLGAAAVAIFRLVGW